MSTLSFLRIQIFLVFAAACLLASCIDEFAGPSDHQGYPEGDREVVIKLDIPQQIMPTETYDGYTTRSVETTTVSDLYILAFQATGKYLNNVPQEPYLYYAKAEKDEKGQWTATLKSANYAQTFVVLANTKNTVGVNYDLTESLEKALASTGKNKTEVLKDLYISLEGNIPPTSELPLCGQTAGQIITQEELSTTVNSSITVKMQRMVARINLYVGDNTGKGLDNFTLKSVHVYNPRLKGCVVSSQLSPGGADDITLPTLPESENEGVYEAPSNTPLVYEADTKNPNIMAQQIYLFENGHPEQFPIEGTDESTDLGLLRPCLIICGEYNGETKYWRVDFTDNATKEPMHILRNYTYNVTITEVKGNGTDSPEEALKTGHATISASIVAWNDSNLGGLSFGENNFLGLGKVAYEYGQGGTLYGAQTVMATFDLPWTAHLVTDKEADPNVAGAPGWIKFMQISEDENQESQLLDKITGIGKGLNTSETLNFYVDEYYDETPRTAYMVFTAGNLEKLTCTITQTNERLLEIVVIGENVMQFTDNGKVFRKVNVGVTPAYETKLSWYYSKGTFGEVTGNVTGEKIFSGMNTVTFGDNLEGTDVSTSPLASGISPKGFLYLTLTDLKNPEKTTTKAIPMEQLEFWLRFQTPTVIAPEDGSEMNINVESNFKWKCIGYCTPELAEENGLKRPGSQREWATPEVIGEYETLVNAFTGEQNGDGDLNGNSIFNITPKAFDINDVSELEKTARMDFLFTDETGSAIVKSDSLLICRALHGPSGNLYQVKKTDQAMTHNQYAVAQVDGQKVMSMSDVGWNEDPMGKWFTASPALSRIISSIYPSETFWFTGELFGNYKQEYVGDGQYKNALFAATITEHDKITPIPMLLVAKNQSNQYSKNYVMVNSYNPMGGGLSYSIHKYTTSNGTPSSVSASYKNMNSNPVIFYSDEFNEKVGEWTYDSSSGDNTPSYVWTEIHFTYGDFPLLDEDLHVVEGAVTEDAYVPFRFKFGDNAFDITNHGYYVKMLVKKGELYKDIKD